MTAPSLIDPAFWHLPLDERMPLFDPIREQGSFVPFQTPNLMTGVPDDWYAVTRYADIVEATIGRPLRYEPGTGAAGGAVFGLLAVADRFASLEVRPGVEVVMELIGFDEALRSADIVLTGEGMVDGQTAFGKTAMGVAERARAAGAHTICFGGGINAEGVEVMRRLGVVTMPVTERPMTLAECAAEGTAPIARRNPSRSVSSHNRRSFPCASAGLAGMRTTLRRMRTSASGGVVVAHFHELGAAHFFDVPLHELFGSITPLADLGCRALLSWRA